MVADGLGGDAQLGGDYASRTASPFLSAGWGIGWMLIAVALVAMTATSMVGLAARVEARHREA